MSDLAIVGCGGLAKEIYTLIENINSIKPTWNFIGFVDKSKNKESVINKYGVIGDDSFIMKYEARLAVIIAIANSGIRERVVNKYLNNQNIWFPNIIHPSFIGEMENIFIGQGNIICANTIISPDVKIGDFNIINVAISIGHDSIIDSYCTINPGSHISGNVKINRSCIIGAGSKVHQGITLAEFTLLGIGSVLTRNTKDNSTYFGNPAKILI